MEKGRSAKEESPPLGLWKFQEDRRKEEEETDGALPWTRHDCNYCLPSSFPFPPFPFFLFLPQAASFLLAYRGGGGGGGEEEVGLLFPTTLRRPQQPTTAGGPRGGTSCQPPTTDRWPQEDQRRFFLQNGRKRKLSSTILLPLRSRAHFREKRLLGLFLVGASGGWRRRRIKYSEGEGGGGGR